MNVRDAQKLSDEIVKILIKEREKKGISQYRISLDCNLSKGSLSNIERFINKPRLYTLFIIAEYLGVNLADIINKIKDNDKK